MCFIDLLRLTLICFEIDDFCSVGQCVHAACLAPNWTRWSLSQLRRSCRLNFVFLSVWSLLIPHILGCHCQLEDLLEAYRSDQRDAYQPVGVPHAPPSEEEMNALAPSSPRSGAPTDSQSGLAPQAGSSSGSGPHSPNTGGASSPLPPASYFALSLLLLILVALPPLPTGLL